MMKNILIISLFKTMSRVGLCATVFFLAGGMRCCYGQDNDTLRGEEDSRMSPVAVHFTPAGERTASDSVPLDEIKMLPYTYTGQFLDGKVAAGLLRQSAEPGVAPLILMRGPSVPIGSEKDLYANRPLYVINGVPLIRNDHPYQLTAKEYAFPGIGSGIDISALIDMNNVSDIRVLKGAEAAARYGVQAANGAILITTRSPQPGKYKIGADFYGGIALQPPVNTSRSPTVINAAYVRGLLTPFYQKYASAAEKINFPAYLADSTGAAYFGAADWNDLYYRQALQHGASLNITGGNNRANFRFGVGEHTESGVADKTALKRYNLYYDMYIVPLKNVSIRTYVQAATASRNRNHSLRERFAEMEYFPNQEYPLPPNKEYLETYYNYLEDGNDKNQVNSIQGSVNIKYEVTGSLSLNSLFSVDYNDNHRDYFVPGTLNDGNSFNSYYSGINRRIRWDNFALYHKSFTNSDRVELQLGQSFEFDKMQYGYIRGYRGPSDFVKVIEVDNVNNEWVTHEKSTVYAYKDYLSQHLVSFYGHATYEMKNKYSATFSLRSDGSSYFGNGYYWAVSPVLSVDWNVKEEPWLKASRFFNALHVNVNGGRTARLLPEDYYGYGPYYTADIGWTGSRNISTYASFPTLSLPFTDGYVGDGIKWPYTDQWEAGIDLRAMGWLNLSLHFYSRTGKDMLVSVPTGGAAYGFSGQWFNGMDVKNAGVEGTIQGDFRLGSSWKWQSGIVFQYNENKLLRLPDGLQALTYGYRRLEVGKPVDQFWLLQNEGIYADESDIPMSPGGGKLTYNGVPFRAGDPRWKDVNEDGIIDDNDRVMQGHVIAPLHGGWNNNIQFKDWTLGLSFLYSAGNNILNGAVAGRFDFANREGADGIEGVKEMTYWQVKGDLDQYPRYNPWSLVNPYQTDQTLFYEKAGFLKLQAVSLKYDLSRLPAVKKSGIETLQLYVTGTNLFTATPYSGNDPSLVDYFGYDQGYAQPLPMTFTLGLHADF